MRWTQEQLDAYEARRKSQTAEPERPVRHEPVGAPQGEAKNTNRIRVRITGFRRRLLDPDNLCPKYFIDCLRYAELIPNDRAEDISLEVKQVKILRKDSECTVIEIEEMQ